MKFYFAINTRIEADPDSFNDDFYMYACMASILIIHIYFLLIDSKSRADSLVEAEVT